MTGQRTKDKMISIAQKGLSPNGRTPFGYYRKEKGNNVLQVHPEQAVIVRDIFKRYAEGETADSIAVSYRDKLPRNSVYYMLTNKHYLGKVVYGEKEYPGQHEPIISKSLFQRVQERRPGGKNMPRPNAQKHTYLLSGLLYCHCGRSLTPYSSHGRSKKYYYYRCCDRQTCRGKQIPAQKVEGLVLDAIKNIPLDTDLIKDCLEILNERRKTRQSKARYELEQVLKALRATKKKRQKLKNFALDGNVGKHNRDEWNDEYYQLRLDIERLETRRKELNGISKFKMDIFQEAEKTIKEIQTCNDVLDKLQGNPEGVRSYFISRIDRIDQVKDGFTIKFNYTGATNRLDWRPVLELFAPLNPGPITIRFEEIAIAIYIILL